MRTNLGKVYRSKHWVKRLARGRPIKMSGSDPGEWNPNVITGVIDFEPNTLNLKSQGKWITCYIELPEGYDVDDIDVSSMLLDEQVPAELRPSEIADNDEDGIADLMLKFDIADIQKILQPGNEVEITVTGELTDGTPFEGIDTIRVIDESVEG